MVFTNFGRQKIAYALGSNVSAGPIAYFAVGTTSGTISASSTTLTGSEYARILQTGNPDFSTNQVVSFQGDLNSVAASGLVLRQFGLFSTAGSNTGSVYDINQLNGSVVCDGTIELQFISAIQVI